MCVACPWSPSFDDMLRMMASSLACWAIPGRCWLILMPGTDVSISVYGPPFLWPGLRSKVSIWLGPPGIQRRMHERCFCVPAALANEEIQPEYDTPKAPARLIFIRSRRVNSPKNDLFMACSLILSG